MATIEQKGSTESLVEEEIARARKMAKVLNDSPVADREVEPKIFAGLIHLGKPLTRHPYGRHRII
jgi:hypothetical protein